MRTPAQYPATIMIRQLFPLVIAWFPQLLNGLHIQVLFVNYEFKCLLGRPTPLVPAFKVWTAPYILLVLGPALGAETGSLSGYHGSLLPL